MTLTGCVATSLFRPTRGAKWSTDQFLAMLSVASFSDRKGRFVLQVPALTNVVISVGQPDCDAMVVMLGIAATLLANRFDLN